MGKLLPRLMPGGMAAALFLRLVLPSVALSSEVKHARIQHILRGSGNSLLTFCGERKYKTILADPPWQFQNRTGKVAPEHKRLNRYPTMRLNEIACLPVNELSRIKRIFTSGYPTPCSRMGWQ